MTAILDSISADIRHALRALAKRPLLFAAAVASIAIGAGLNLGVYAVLRHVMFDSVLTAAAPDRLVRIAPGISYPNYRDLRSTDLPIDLAAMQMARVTWRTPNGTKILSAHVVSDNFFDVAGVRPILGRTFTAGDRERTDLAVITYSFWQHSGGDPTIVGRSIELNGWPYVIAGVLPRGFTAVAIMSGTVYVPIGAHVGAALENRRVAQFDLFGRLRDGVAIGQAAAALRGAAERIEAGFPDANRGFARSLTVSSMDAFSFLRQMPAGQMILAAAAATYGLVGLVLLVACANVASLLVSRADERRNDIAVRLALGATRARLMQQFLAESLVIAIVGCAAGASLWILAAAWLRATIIASSTAEITALDGALPIRLGLLLVCAVTVACGVAPAMRANQLSIVAALQARRTGGVFRRVSLQRLLVGAQIAICFVLLTAAIFLLHNLLRLQIADPGFDVAHTLTIDLQFPSASRPRTALDRRLAVQAEPGVQAVSWGWPIGPPFTERIRAAGAGDRAVVAVDVRRVGPRFFETMRIPLASGRDLTDEDVGAAAAKPIVVNETFARRYLAGVDPLGRQFVRPRDAENGRNEQVLQIVGVARDTLARTVGDGHVPVVYLPQPAASLTVRMAGPAAAAVRPLAQRIERIEPPGTVVTVSSMADSVDAALRPVRTAAALLGALGATAIVLATTGLVALISRAIARRTFEIGVRMALGASRAAIVRMILRDGLSVVSAGCLAGAALSFAFARVLQSLITSQSLVDPVAFGAALLLLLIVSVAAAVPPAQRTAAAEPVVALRSE
jgi:putative ABC transport system permease protein